MIRVDLQYIRKLLLCQMILSKPEITQREHVAAV